MDARTRIPLSVLRMVLAIALAGLSTQVGATLSVDGVLNGTDGSAGQTAADAQAEGYSVGFAIPFLTTAGDLVGDAFVYFGVDDSNNLFMYFQEPLSYVDNTYGANTDPSWGTTTHQFSDLMGTQWTGLQWMDLNGNTASVAIDYLSRCGADNSNCGPSGYASAGVLNSDSGAGASDLIAVASSLQWDLNNVCSSCTTDSPDLALTPNWITTVGYELVFAPGTFDPSTWLSASNPFLAGDTSNNLTTFGTVTSMPNKPNLTTVVLGDAPQVLGSSSTTPEPGTPWLLAAALAALGWFAYRREQNRAGVRMRRPARF